ncbi:MAG: GTP 3',8-cyclase MoaA [Anaerolineales bacterium]
MSNEQILDKFDRPFTDLRISVTDRCNFRCQYCMPKEIFGSDYPFLPTKELLTIDEIARFVKAVAPYGLRKVRLTGGEPLVRAHVEDLVQILRDNHPDLELAMTTNGSLLPKKAPLLKKAGLDRVTISLDSLEDEVFMAMNGVNFPVQKVLDGISAAEDQELFPIKINMVVKRGVNDQSILPMAEYFRERGHTLRFIEYMDVGSTNGWKMDEVVPARQILERLQAVHPLIPVEPDVPSEVAKRWKYKDSEVEIGLIASVTDPFCGNCTRLRMSSAGELFTCLFANQGHDLKSLLRGDASDTELKNFLASLWGNRSDNYSQTRTAEGNSDEDRIEMSYIGG